VLIGHSVAGSHTTSGTLTLLFSHLLGKTDILAKVIAEIDAQLSDITDDVVPIKGLELKLPYTMACINENFRINPVFSMPLPRLVFAPEGHAIGGHQIPPGVSLSHL
jgi:benzoate 4-monooxygenase